MTVRDYPSLDTVQRLRSEGLMQKEIGKRYGISQQAIFDILNRKRCIECGRPITRNATRCNDCHLKRARGKVVNWGEKRDDWVTLVCEVCGEEFEVRNNQATTRHTCSWECRQKRPIPSKQVNQICEVCGKEFSVAPSGSHRKYCSRDCAGKATRKPRETRHCLECGAEFETTMHRDQTFCSRKCATDYSRGRSNPNQARDVAGEKHPNWRGGISFEPYGPGWTKELRQIVRKRDDYTCAICWHEGKHVHHIDYNKRNNSPTNLITMCAACHGIVHYNRGYWQPVFSQMLANRTWGRLGLEHSNQL